MSPEIFAKIYFIVVIRMDKILSARVDESVVEQITLLAAELNMTKKAIIESAIKHYSEQKRMDKKINVFKKTCGIWKREKTAEESISEARLAFNKSMKRHYP